MRTIRSLQRVNQDETAARQPDGLDGAALLSALRALRNGDLRVRLPEGEAGIAGAVAEAFNDIVELNQRTAQELRRISRAVGREGRISHRVSIGPAGSWARNEAAVNQLVFDLTEPMLEISRVMDAVARGDLSQRMAMEIDGQPLKGEYKRLADTINTMVDQLNAFASEVTRVAREVGTEGKLGGQADVHGVGGTWKDLTDSVNSMAGNLTAQVRNIADVTTAVAKGDLSKKITVDVQGEILELKNTINTMVDQLNLLAGEVTRVAHEVGTEGKLGGQADVRGVAGTWKDLTDNVNTMSLNLTARARNIAEVTMAVARGDLSKKITVDVRGEFLEQKNTINVMVDQLNAFASEVTRVAREVGTEGKLGGEADVPGVAGTWKDLTDNVNSMAGNLTGQVRNIADVTTAVAKGDLSKKITVDARGEILELKDTINTMVDQLNAFASEVTRVAREVGTEGKLGGQADVRGVGGTWKDLTDSVNQLAANLTTQVRAIGEVATAVTRGDLSRSVQVHAQGEVALLKDDVNEMIRNLRETTQRNRESDWLKTNIARFGQLLQGQRDLQMVGRLILTELAPLVGVQRGVFYLANLDGEPSRLSLLATYPRHISPEPAAMIRFGEGLLGQAAEDRRRIHLRDVPPDYAADLIGARRRGAPIRRPSPHPVRGRDAGRDRARIDRGSQRHPDRLPGPARGEHRDRPEHHHGQHAGGGPGAGAGGPGGGRVRAGPPAAGRRRDAGGHPHRRRDRPGVPEQRRRRRDHGYRARIGRDHEGRGPRRTPGRGWHPRLGGSPLGACRVPQRGGARRAARHHQFDHRPGRAHPREQRAVERRPGPSRRGRGGLPGHQPAARPRSAEG